MLVIILTAINIIGVALATILLKKKLKNRTLAVGQRASG